MNKPMCKGGNHTIQSIISDEATDHKRFNNNIKSNK